VKCAAEHRDTALDVLVDMLRHSKFDPDEIEREKGVIVEEMNMYYDTPRDYIDGVYDELLYGDSPLGWDIIGRKETVRSATREMFVSYLDSWYRAPRMVAGLAGAIGDDAVSRLGELLGDVPDGSSPSLATVDMDVNGSPVKVHSKQSDQAHVRLGVLSYPIDHPDRYALNLLATALGGGMSSRLFTEVRERRGLAYYIFGYNQGYTDTGTLYAQGGVDIQRIDEAVQTIAREFQRIADEPLEQEELDKARNFAKGRLVLSLEDPKGTILFGLRSEVLEGRVREPDEALAGFDAVTTEDVQRVAQDVIGGDRLRLAVIGPFDEAARFEELLAVPA
jgi:predicted Zn-dependent peptidase